MEKHQLARELRQRQYETGIFEKRFIDTLSDDQIIDCYITCSECGEKQVTPQMLETAIEFANSADEFFVCCDSLARAQALAYMPVRSPRKAKARRQR